MKILIATDGSEFSKAAVNEVCRLFPDLSNSSIMIVSAYEELHAIAAEPFALSAEYYQRMIDAAERNARYYADAAADVIRGRAGNDGIEIATHVVAGPPVKQIIEAAETWGAELIVVGSHGHGFWGRMLGSVSNGVVHHAACSVLVVRKGKE